MPVLAQGDIFDAAPRLQLAIVFGHLGFNRLNLSWRSFRDGHPSLREVRNPFDPFPNQPLEYSKAHYLWFVPEPDNNGLSDTQLEASLDKAFQWAYSSELHTIATNGIANTDHRHEIHHDQQSDNRRAAYLIDYAVREEELHDIRIELINLSDIFVRQHEINPTDVLEAD